MNFQNKIGSQLEPPRKNGSLEALLRIRPIGLQNVFACRTQLPPIYMCFINNSKLGLLKILPRNEPGVEGPAEGRLRNGV